MTQVMLRGLARLFPVFCMAALCVLPALAADPQSAAKFLESAHSSALLQLKAAEIAASRDARPEAKLFAREMVAFRTAHLQRLEALAKQNNAAPPKDLTFEQRVLIDNLAPLDFLALSRRYAQLQVRTLEQETEAYEAAAEDATLAAFKTEYLPLLRQQLDRARSVANAIGP
jgi:putative membrane protein